MSSSLLMDGWMDWIHKLLACIAVQRAMSSSLLIDGWMDWIHKLLACIAVWTDILSQSMPLPFTHGVLQGFCLGPVKFVAYTLDIPMIHKFTITVPYLKSPYWFLGRPRVTMISQMPSLRLQLNPSETDFIWLSCQDTGPTPFTRVLQFAHPVFWCSLQPCSSLRQWTDHDKPYCKSCQHLPVSSLTALTPLQFCWSWCDGSTGAITGYQSHWLLQRCTRRPTSIVAGTTAMTTECGCTASTWSGPTSTRDAYIEATGLVASQVQSLVASDTDASLSAVLRIWCDIVTFNVSDTAVCEAN